VNDDLRSKLLPLTAQLLKRVEFAMESLESKRANARRLQSQSKGNEPRLRQLIAYEPGLSEAVEQLTCVREQQKKLRDWLDSACIEAGVTEEEKKLLLS